MSDHISHYGVKGMRWGVRKKSSGRGTNNPLKDLSDDDLQKAVNRMRLEQQYRDLASGKNNSNKSLGKKLAEQVVSKEGTKLATALIGAGMTAVGAAIASKAAIARSNNKHKKYVQGLKDF
jgi:hypothetical protein